MPRYARLHQPGDYLHVITRFVDREFRLDVPAAREKYLRCLVEALARTGWRLVAYALMSSHIHLILVAGPEPLAAVTRPAHSRFARWLNRREARLGPVFASRPKCAIVNRRIAHAIEYVHNNPVRAGVVARAIDSMWTSHRAYVAVDDAPSWLDVETGLAGACYLADASGREAFARLVEDSAENRRDADLSLNDAEGARAAIRRTAGSPVELGTPTLGVHRLEWPVLAREPSAPLRPRWSGDIRRVVTLAARTMGIADWRGRDAQTVAARRLALRAACVELNRTLTDASAALGISLSRGSELLKESREHAALERHAKLIASALAA